MEREATNKAYTDTHAFMCCTNLFCVYSIIIMNNNLSECQLRSFRVLLGVTGYLVGHTLNQMVSTNADKCVKKPAGN